MTPLLLAVLTFGASSEQCRQEKEAAYQQCAKIEVHDRAQRADCFRRAELQFKRCIRERGNL